MCLVKLLIMPAITGSSQGAFRSNGVAADYQGFMVGKYALACGYGGDLPYGLLFLKRTRGQKLSSESMCGQLHTAIMFIHLIQFRFQDVVDAIWIGLTGSRIMRLGSSRA